MRIAVLASLVSVLTLALAGNAGPAQTDKRQVTRNQLVARARYPEFFGRRGRIETRAPLDTGNDDDAPIVAPNTGSGGSTGSEAGTGSGTGTGSGSGTDTGSGTGTGSGSQPVGSSGPTLPNCPNTARRRRDVRERFETPLGAKEMAKFLLGHGEFTWDNGTTYRDEHYAYILSRASLDYPSYYRRAFNTIKDKVGNQYLEVTIPAYKKFMRTWKEGELIWISDHTAIRAGDMDDVPKYLLEAPEFEEIQVHGWKVSRKFVEVLEAY